MDDKQKQFFSAMESLFESPGWKLLSDGWREEQERLPMDAFFNAKDFEYVTERRIRYELLTQLIELPSQIDAQREAIEQGNE